VPQNAVTDPGADRGQADARRSRVAYPTLLGWAALLLEVAAILSLMAILIVDPNVHVITVPFWSWVGGGLAVVTLIAAIIKPNRTARSLALWALVIMVLALWWVSSHQSK
jgi:hypothetical protein